ncbi:bifunctional glutathione transferase/peroxidase [Cryomyces antarcticus]|uniref:Bifunctional glutathione transferase/peroxidase n=1 Tax=Cryomyces antarcticus TaxID=329879 RepID=A0ABR0KV39_9PEZI|nr:bifunctional glutathione transferase/peroxidase [Cryomyces antarcticus]KAK5132074.1 bifunctional glutathione transferase/peroxidase [Cryomyces antarcticus]
MSEAAKSGQAKVTLYWLEKSRSQRILWLLEECKVEYDLKIYKRGEDMLAPKELKEIHPLGKSPVIGVQGPGAEKPLILAESGAIVEYLTEYFGKHLIPSRYREGKTGQIGGESEEWLRYRFFMHYAEGSLMLLMVVALLINNIRNSAVPFFIKPITRGIAGKVDDLFLKPNFKTHFEFLEEQIATSPGGGEYLCGKELTGADILMSFPLIAAQGRSGLTADHYPKLCSYIFRIQEEEGYKSSIRKIEEMTGEEFSPSL